MDDVRTNHRRVYAKGYYDGLEAGGGMTPARRESIVRGLPVQAQKVFECVPGNGQWTAQQIVACIYDTTKSKMDPHTVNGCLDRLVDAGIVKEAKRGQFQRTKVSNAPALGDESANPSEPGVPAPLVNPPPTPVDGPIDMLADLAGRLSRVADDVRTIVADIETAALRIEEQKEGNARDAEKLRKFAALLKEL